MSDLVQPPMIRYNLKERGRQYRGVERNFNIPEIVAAINSPACQELVRTRGMLGYLGHWVRIRFGLEPPEGGIVNGQSYSVEPAIVTTFLKAYPNGDVEHQTEFLNTKPGLIASRMYFNKVGGFSSVIDENKPAFHGFDWVNDPNYSTNRGYNIALDSVTSGAMTLDDVIAAEFNNHTQAMAMLLEASEYREKLALDSAVSLRLENDQLLSLLSEYDQATKIPTMVGDVTALQRMENDKALFDSTIRLPKTVEPETDAARKAKRDYDRIRSRVVNS